MAVNFNAEPSPEGLALAAQLRRERLQRDKALEDRIAEAEMRDREAAGQVRQESVAGRLLTVVDAEAESVVDEKANKPAVGANPVDESAVEDFDRPSPLVELEALAALSRTRKTDRQR